ncbi:MAG: CDP-glucose 4,6-dehydratase [Thermodesulfobacteriota bacterium]
MADHDFWKNKRVLVSGHTGFKGGWLCLWLQKLGAQVVGYSLPPPTEPSLFEAATVARAMTSVIGDVRNFAPILDTISKHEPEVVIHMAAQSLVRRSYRDPVETYGTNIMGTVNVLEAVRLSETAKVVIIVTSDKCYENAESTCAYGEDAPLGGHDPYSSSKACAELVTAAYRSSFFSRSGDTPVAPLIATVRAGNVIGGGDWSEDRLIPDIMKAFLAGAAPLIRNPSAVRPWQHVLDALRGYLLLAEHLWEKGSEYAQAWNFGPNPVDARSVEWVADQLADMWGDGARWEADRRLHPYEAQNLILDSTKAGELLGWRSKLTLPEALAWTCSWFKSYGDNASMRARCEADISAFVEKQVPQ